MSHKSYLIRCVLILSFGSIASLLTGQDRIIFTTSFSDKLDKFNLDYYEPVEGWLHPIPQQNDEYGKFDLILSSSKGDVDIMYLFKEANDPDAITNHPHLDLLQEVAHLATNRQSESIIISEISPGIVDTVFYADWGLYADFIPKRSLSNKRQCRMLAIQKEQAAMIYSILCYDEEVPAYFDLPISFKNK